MPASPPAASRGRTPVPAVVLVEPALHHEAEFLAAVTRSRRLHGRWVTPPGTAEQFRRFVSRLSEPSHRGHLVFTQDGDLVGVVVISEIVRGGFQSGYLGYYAFAPWAGLGCMRAALDQVLSLAFGAYALHRLEANIQPENLRSRTLIESLGFRCEGYSPRYLKIRGRWRDHERWALTAEERRRPARLSARQVPPARREGRAG